MRNMFWQVLFLTALTACGGSDSDVNTVEDNSSGGCGSTSSGTRDLSSGGETLNFIAVNLYPDRSIVAVRIVPWLQVDDGPDLLGNNTIDSCSRFTLILSCSAYPETQRLVFELSDGSIAVDPATDFNCGEDNVFSAGA